MAVPHPHFDSDDEDLFPVSGKLKLLAGQGGAAAKADEDSEDELSPASSPVAAKKKRKTSSPGWGGARLKPCHTYAEALGPIQNTALTLRVWKSVDFKLRTRKQKLDRTSSLQANNGTRACNLHKPKLLCRRANRVGFGAPKERQFALNLNTDNKVKSPLLNLHLHLRTCFFQTPVCTDARWQKSKMHALRKSSQITVYFLFSLLHGKL